MAPSRCGRKQYLPCFVYPTVLWGVAGFVLCAQWVRIQGGFPPLALRYAESVQASYTDGTAYSLIAIWFLLMPGIILSPILAIAASTRVIGMTGRGRSWGNREKAPWWRHTRRALVAHGQFLGFLLLALGIGLVARPPSWRADHGAGLILLAAVLGILQIPLSVWCVLPVWVFLLQSFRERRLKLAAASLELIAFLCIAVLLAWHYHFDGLEDETLAPMFLYIVVCGLIPLFLFAFGGAGKVDHGGAGWMKRVRDTADPPARLDK